MSVWGYVPFDADIIDKLWKGKHPPLGGMGWHLRLRGRYEKLCAVKTALTIAAAAAAILMSCACRGEGTAFEFTGQVAQVYAETPRRLIVIRPDADGSGFEPSTLWMENPDSHPAVKGGDIVKVLAERTEPHGKIRGDLKDGLASIVSKIEVTGHDAFPEGAACSAEDVLSGRRLHKFVRVSGVLSSATLDETDPELRWFTLRTPAGDIHACAPYREHTLREFLALTDAEVEVRALVTAQNRWKKFSGPFLLPLGKDGIRTVKPPPAAAPEFTGNPRDADSFARRAARGDFAHRVRMSGLVVAECRKWLFMSTADGMLVKLVMQSDAQRQTSGTMVHATGFVSYDCAGLVMHDTVLSPAPDAPRITQPKPIETTLKRIFWRTQSRNDFSRRIVSFTAKSVIAPEIIHEGNTLWVNDDGHFAAVDLSEYMTEKRIDRPDATLRITGVYDPSFDSDPAMSSFPKFKGITVVPLPQNGVDILYWPIWTFRLLAFLAINLVVIVILVTIALIVQKIRCDRRGQQLMEERVARARAQTKTDERTRLAAELHDAVSQALTGVALQIDSANIVNRGENAALSKYLDTARQMLASCRRELRDCLWDLRSQAFDEKDMTEAVKRTIFSHTGGAKTMVRFNVERCRLSESKAHAILSTTRELVVNAVRHGKATQIWIAGECSDGHVSFSVRDNGCGFDPDAAPGVREGHFGLQGIRERVRAAKGTIKVESAAGKGAKITITLPEADVQ